MRIGQKIKEEKIGTLSHNAGIISLTPSTVNVGGVQVDTDALTRTISTDVTMAANTLYMIYVVLSSGVPAIRISANYNSVGPAGFSSWKLVGAFYANGMSPVVFGSFINITGVPKTEQPIEYQGSIVDTTNTVVTSGSFVTKKFYWEREGILGLYKGAYYHTTSVGINGSGLYHIKPPSTHDFSNPKYEVTGGGNSGNPRGGRVTGDLGGGVFIGGTRNGYYSSLVNGFNGVSLRLYGDTDGGVWGASGSGGVFDGYAMITTYLGITWADIPAEVNTFSNTQIKDL